MNRTKTICLGALRLIGVIGLGVALSGCVIEPLYGPHDYRPYRGSYY